MTKITQNAIRVVETGEIIVSLHPHNFVTAETPSGKTIHVDGGNAYLKRGGDAPYEELSLYEDSSVWEQINKCLWGTRGPNGDQPLKHILLKDAELDHLQKILEIRSLPNYYYHLIHLILALKTSKEIII